MMEFVAPKDIRKIQQQIKALEELIKNDTNEKDREYHQMALQELKQKLKELQK